MISVYSRPSIVSLYHLTPISGHPKYEIPMYLGCENWETRNGKMRVIWTLVTQLCIYIYIYMGARGGLSRKTEQINEFASLELGDFSENDIIAA